MSDNFTEDLRRALTVAREEASRLRHSGVRPEHLTLGALKTGSSRVRRLLGELSPGEVRTELERRVASTQETTSAAWELPYTETSKAALEQAMRHARGLGHGKIGPEHLLLGVLGVGDGIAAALLQERGVDLGQAIEHVRQAHADGAA